MKCLIRGTTLVDPSIGIRPHTDILIEDGIITAIDDVLPSGDAAILQADNWICAPGLIDMHVHLRDPGQTYKEDIHSGCRAAAAGGVTAVACMPNTTPAADDPTVIREILQKAETADARVYPVAAVTRSLKGEELTDFAALKQAGAVGFSDDGRPVPTAGMMQRAMLEAQIVGAPLLSHSEDLSLVRGGIMNAGDIANRLGVRGIDRAAEEVATAREVALAAGGLPVHICHVSTAESVAIIRDAKRRGIPVTCETAPHYFSLTDDLLLSRNANYRMNPPLRTAADVQAIIEGIKDGTIDAIATDHAPHSAEDKENFETAPNGVVGLETSLAAGLTYLVGAGHISMTKLIELMSVAPARLLGVPGGRVAVGEIGDLVLFDPTVAWTVEADRLVSRSHNTPFDGRRLTGRVMATVCKGRIVYEYKEEV